MVTLSELKQKKQGPSPKREETKSNPTIKRKSLKKFDRNLENPESNKPENQDLEALKQELNKLKEENLLLKSGTNLTKNEEKILNAVRSEKIEQDTDLPIISTSMLRKKYKVSAKYQGESIRGLINKSLIEREETSYSGNVKTYRWKIISQ